MQKYSRFTLASGLKVLMIPQNSTDSLTLLVLTKVGSRYEHAKNNGVSHFIEHLMFKGTSRRPSCLDLSKELDSIGAEYNAYTGKDHTGYYIKASKKHLDLALDMLSDILFNSKFPEAEIARERGVILEEINMYEDNPLLDSESLLEKLVFGSQHALGRMITGPKEVIKGITRSEIISYRDQFYGLNNMVLALAGNLPRDAEAKIKKYFNLPKRRIKPQSYQKFRARQNKPQLEIKYKATEQAQLVLGFPAYHYLDPRLPALNLLAVLLGGNMSSRLFINIRERQGLCYFIKSELSIYEDTGLLVIQAGLDKSRITHALTAILKELEIMKQLTITEEELQKAKDFVEGRTILNMEDSAEQAEWYATQQLLTQKIYNPAEKLKRIKRVTAAQIQAVAKDIFVTRKLNLAIVGPVKDKIKLSKLLSIK